MAELVKICPRCLFHNPDTVNSCLRCPSSLAGVEATDPDAPVLPDEHVTPVTEGGPDHATDLATATALRLELAADPTRGFVVLAGQTVGAPGHAERPDVPLAGVPDEDYISGRHARVLRHGSDWFVQHLGQTNFIVVDGARHDERDEVPVHAGSSVFLTYTEFIVRAGDAP